MRWLSLVLLLALPASPALAQTKVTIYPRFYVPGLDTPVEETPSAVQVIQPPAEIRADILSPGDALLQDASGVNVDETAGNPFQPDVTYHGFTASPLPGSPVGLSVYQDGVRVNEPFGDVVNWDLIPENAVAGITLMPGSNPVYGLNTLGGAIAVRTKNGIDNPGTQMETYGGSWGRRAVEGETGGSLPNGLNWFFSGNALAEDGWRQDSPSRVDQAFGKLGWKGEKADVEASFTAADNSLSGLGYTPKSMLNTLGRDSILTSPDVTDNRLVFLTLKGGYRMTDETYLSSIAYLRLSHSATVNGNANGDYGSPGSAGYPYGNIINGNDFNEAAITSGSTGENSTGITLQARDTHSLMDHRNTLVGGISYDHAAIDFSQVYAEGGLAPDREALPLFPFVAQVGLDGTDAAEGIFATDDFSVTDSTNLTLSGRYNITQVNTSDALNPAGPSSLSGHENFQSFNPAVGLTHSFSEALNIYGGFSRGSRVPSAIEIGCSNPLSPCALPNAMAGDPPDLKQVIARTWEGGFRGKFSKASDWNLGFWRTVSRDDIQFVASNSAGEGYFTNVGRTLRQGMDAGARAKIGKVTLSLSYSFVDATYQSPFQIANDANASSFMNADGAQVIQVNKGDRIPGIPQHQLKLRGEWQALPECTIGAEVLAFSSQYAYGDENNADPAGRIPGYAVVNLDTRYTLPDTRWQIFADVNNLFNTRYATGGLLGQNNFTPDGSFRSDGGTAAEPFLSPGSPLAVWVGVRWKIS